MPASEVSNERPKKKLKPEVNIDSETVNHNDPYLTRRNKDSELVVEHVKNKKAEEQKTKKKLRPIEEKPAQKIKESPLIKEKVVKPKEKQNDKPKEKPKQPKEVREKDRESPISERAEKPTKNRLEKRIEKPNPVINIHKAYINDVNGTNNKNTNGNTTEREIDPKSSLRELVNTQFKKKKSNWLQNVKPVNNNNNEPKDLRTSAEIPAVDLRINLTASSEKQIVVEDDDLIYNEFFS